MQCQACKEHTATIHLTEISNGKRVESHLCESCAQQQGLAVKNQVPINELLSTLLAVQIEAKGPTDEPDMGSEDVKCPCCSMSLKRFHKTGLMGCPNDYEVFEKSLSAIIEKYHGPDATHCGKVPSKTPGDTKKQVEVISLKQKLDTAVKAEDYETAAKLRDQIEQLQ